MTQALKMCVEGGRLHANGGPLSARRRQSRAKDSRMHLCEHGRRPVDVVRVDDIHLVLIVVIVDRHRGVQEGRSVLLEDRGVGYGKRGVGRKGVAHQGIEAL